MTGLRLGPVEDQKSVKTTLEISSALMRDIVEYAEVHARVTGRSAPLSPERLIPPIVELFIAGDRAFIKQRKKS